MQPLKILFWRSLAVIALLLGMIGVFLPIMPTVPFVLLAAWAASKGWPRLEVWLLDHPAFGQSIRNWRENGAVTRRAKWFASGAMLSSAVTLQYLPLPDWGHWVRWGVPMLFVCVAAWLWQRPEE